MTVSARLQSFMRVALLIVAGLSWIGVGTPGDGAASVSITVRDATSGAPLENVEVFFLGGQPVSGLTDRNGVFAAEDVAPGTYAVRVQRSGYQRREIAVFAVAAGRQATLAISLPGLTEIGHVRAAVAARQTPEVTQSSPLRNISESLVDALSRVAGVNVDASSSSPGISLRNQDASQTAISIDGVRQSGKASSAALKLAGDLFTSASVDFNGTAGASAGTIDFRTLEPARRPLTAVAAGYDTLGGSAYTAAYSAPVGKLGIALQHTWRGAVPVLQGNTYADLSGSSYAHDGAARNTADLLKLKYTFGPRLQASAYYIGGTSRNADLCNAWLSNVPCGYGPGNATSEGFATYGVRAIAQIGNVSVVTGAYGTRTASRDDQTNRVIDGVAVPAIAAERLSGSGGNVTAAASSGRHSLRLLVAVDHSRDDVERTSGGKLSTTRLDTQLSTVSVSDTFKMSSLLSVRGGISFASGTDVGASAITSLRVDWRPSKRDALYASASVGSISPTDRPSRPLSDAPAASYDCANRSVIVQGPNDPATKQSATSVELGARHNWSRGDVNVAIYRKSEIGTGFPSLVPLVSQGGLDIPAGYVDQIFTRWNAADVCGGTAFDPSRIFVGSEVIANVYQRYQGFTVSGRVLLGKRVMLFPVLAVNAATAFSSDPRLLAPTSLRQSGQQIPLRPMRTGGLTVDVAGTMGTEWLLNAQYTSANNRSNLPAGFVVNAGVVKPLGRGRLTLLVANVTNAGTGSFVRSRGIGPLQLNDGTSFIIPTTPAQPFRVVMRYDFTTSPH